MATRESSRSHKATFPDSLPERTLHVLALTILFVLPLLLFWPTILGNQQFMGHDTVQWRAGAESIFDYRDTHEGEEPLWATNMFGGMPAYTVHVFKSVPHLDNALFDQLRSIWPAIPYWTLAGGLYLLFILMGFRPLNALLGATLFALTTYFPIIIGAGHNIKFIAYSYLPWMLAGYWLLTRSRHTGWGFFLFAVAATLEFRAGHPQVTYYFVYLFAALFLHDGWRAWNENRIRPFAAAGALIAGATVLALLGTAEQYWRLIEYSPHSIRGGSDIAETGGAAGLSLEYAFSWSQGLLETLTLMIPDLYGGSSGMAYWGEKPGTSGPHYFGAAGVILFLIGLFRSRKAIRLLFAGVGLLAMTFSWGYHFPLNELWFHLLPGFDKFRTPEMWLTLTVFCFTVVALFGVETILEQIKMRKMSLKPLMLPAGLALGTGLLILLAGTTIFPLENPHERAQISRQIAMQHDLAPDNPQVRQQASRIIESRLKPERAELMRNSTIRFLLLAGAAAGLIALAMKATIAPGWMLLGLLALTMFDLAGTGKRYIGEHSMTDRSLELTRVIEAQQTPADRWLADHAPQPEGYAWRVLPLDENPFNNAVPSYFYPSIGGYSGAKLSVIQDVIDDGLFTGPAGINRAVLDMLNVKYLSTRREVRIPGFEPVFSEQGHFVYRNESVLPKAWFVEQAISAANPRESFRAILPESGFNPAETAVVESRQIPETHADPNSHVELISYTARRIELNLRRELPGFLVLSEIWYPPGWTAKLNGEEIPIYKTNYLLRGFAIPAGEHQLSLEFHPRSHVIGSRISWTANLIQWSIGLFLLAGWIRRRNSDGVDHVA